MRRRLDLAAALVHNPEVLFLDEPTTGLDPISRASVWQEVQRLNDELGMTILLTTQYLEEADELADRVGIVDNGRLVAEGTPDRAQAHASAPTSSSPASRATPTPRGAALDGVYGVVARRGPRPRAHDQRRRRLVGDRAGRHRAARRRRSGSATSRCARRRSTTCSSSSPAPTSTTTTTREEDPS